MAIANGAIYPIVVAQALRPSHMQPVAPQRCRTLYNWVWLPRKSGSFLADQYQHAIAHPTSVMLSTVVLVALGYMMQRVKKLTARIMAMPKSLIANHTIYIDILILRLLTKFCCMIEIAAYTNFELLKLR